MIKRIINNKISIEREEMPDAIPYHIRHEYERFCSMIEDEQYAGAWFELRDLVEVTLKFPVLLGLSYMFQKESIDFENREVKNILELLLTKRLSLGVHIAASNGRFCGAKRPQCEADRPQAVAFVSRILS